MDTHKNTDNCTWLASKIGNENNISMQMSQNQVDQFTETIGFLVQTIDDLKLQMANTTSKMKSMENSLGNNEQEISRLKTSNEKLTIDNEKLKVMVELQIGSFCEDLKNRVQNQTTTNQDQSNQIFRNLKSQNINNIPSLDVNKQKI